MVLLERAAVIVMMRIQCDDEMTMSLIPYCAFQYTSTIVSNSLYYVYTYLPLIREAGRACSLTN